MNKPPFSSTRRKFLGQASCSAVGSLSLLSALINLRLTGTLAASTTSDDDYRALVCVFLAGGNDSFNMLTPVDEDGYEEYLLARGSIALPKENFTPLPNSLPAPDSRTLGLNKEMSGLNNLYSQGKAAFVANVGTLVEQVSKESILSQSASLPLGLYSHSDQQLHWQSGLPSTRAPLDGWGGRLSELVNDLNGESGVSMNVSLAGLNMFQSGDSTSIFSRRPFGTPGVRNWNNENFQPTRNAINSILENEYQNAFERTFASSKKEAIATSEEYRAALSEQTPLETSFDSKNNGLSSQLRAVAETIAARDSLSKKRQTFFVEVGGWDHHNGLENHPAMLGQLSQAVSEFQAAMAELKVEENVTLFTASDFGRTLTPNGNGSDHAWGGHQFVVGGAVNGGKVYGSYPSLALDNNLDTGRGRFIPTTSVDQYVADLALWMGVSKSDLHLVLPNLGNFHDVVTNGAPLGLFGGA